MATSKEYLGISFDEPGGREGSVCYEKPLGLAEKNVNEKNYCVWNVSD